MEWGRLKTIRTAVLIIGGGAAFAVAGFMVRPWVGLAVLGAVCWFLEFMTGDRGDQTQQRR